MNITKSKVAFRNFSKCAYDVYSGNRLRKCGLEFSGPGLTSMAGSYEHCNERSGFTVCEEFYWPRNWYVLKKYCAAWSILFVKIFRCNSAYLTGFDCRTYGLQTYHCEHLHDILSLSLCTDHVFLTVHNVTKFRLGWGPSQSHTHKPFFLLFPFLKYSPSRNIFQKKVVDVYRALYFTSCYSFVYRK